MNELQVGRVGSRPSSQRPQADGLGEGTRPGARVAADVVCWWWPVCVEACTTFVALSGFSSLRGGSMAIARQGRGKSLGSMFLPASASCAYSKKGLNGTFRSYVFPWGKGSFGTRFLFGGRGNTGEERRSQAILLLEHRYPVDGHADPFGACLNILTLL